MKIIQEFLTTSLIVGHHVGKEIKSRFRNRYRTPKSKLTIFKRDMIQRNKWDSLVELYKQDKEKFNRIRKDYWKMRGWGKF